MVGNRGSDSWAEHICHPAPLAAVLILVVNDHVLKGAGVLPASVTGKLSDIAGLFFFPLLLSALVRAANGFVRGSTSAAPGTALFCVVATGAAFVALKTSTGFNSLASRFWGNNTLDATDLWALFALVPSWLWMRRSSWPRFPRRMQLAAVVASGLASIATSHPRGMMVRNYPKWILDGGRRTMDVGCARAEPWVVKSGKEGTGVTLELTSRVSDACSVQVQKADFLVAGRPVAAATVPGSVRVGELPTRIYLPFLFDGDEAWNAGHRAATLRLVLLANDTEVTLQVQLNNKLNGELYVWSPAEGDRK